MIFDLSAFNNNLHLQHDTFKTLTFYKNKERKKAYTTYLGYIETKYGHKEHTGAFTC